jgi:NAD-dependent DNA ligase
MATVKQIASKIKGAADAYYNTGEPVMSDADFDALVDELRERDPGNAVLTQVGAPVTGAKVDLPYPMMSLDKVKAGTDKWAAKHPGPYVVSDKLDGTSAMLAGHKLYRRGTGKVGADVSHLIPHVISKKAAATKLVVRGEIVISKADFDGSVAVDARSAVNALVNKKTTGGPDPVLDAARFVAYEVVEPRMEKVDQFKALKTAGFEVAWHETVATIDDAMLADKFSERRAASKYNVDGVVVQASGVHDIGDKNPTYAFAFKSVQEDQGRRTVVTDVVYESSRDGRLVPRVSFDPIVLDTGVTMRWATAHNARFVQDHGIGPGAVVHVVRSGDVIPKIIRVDEPVQPKLPGSEPEWAWDANGVHAVLTVLGDTAKIKILLKFMTSLGVEFTKEGSLTKMYEAGFDTVKKILDADPADIADIPGFGAVQAKKMLGSLTQKVAGADAIELMVASNAFGSGIGERKLRALHASVPDFHKLRGPDLEARVLEAPGFQDKTAAKVVQGMDEFDRVVKALGLSLKGRSVNKSAQAVAAKGKVVFSGFRDADLEDAAVAAGYDVSTSVSSKTALVVASDVNAASGKITKARELGVEVVSIEDFRKLC